VLSYPYVNTLAGNSMLSKSEKRLIVGLRRARRRSKEGLFLVEGIRTVDEALSADFEVFLCLQSPKLRDTGKGRQLAENISERSVEVRNVSDTELDTISDTANTQGVLLVCHEPQRLLFDLRVETSSTFLIVDGIQDPGNLGTLIRAARAFAVSAIICLEGTVDSWNSKVVRASAGAIFHSHIFSERWSDLLVWLREHSVTVIAADAHGKDIGDFQVSTPWVLAVGNENKGIRRDILEISERVAIPMSEDVESLNAGVAGSTLLYLLTSNRSI